MLAVSSGERMLSWIIFHGSFAKVIALEVSPGQEFINEVPPGVPKSFDTALSAALLLLSNEASATGLWARSATVKCLTLVWEPYPNAVLRTPNCCL